MLFVLNIARIGTLSMAAASPKLFEFLHLYAWPTVLAATAAALVLGWMRSAGGSRIGFRRAGWVAFCALAPFAIAAPTIGASEAVAAACRLVAGATASAMSTAGVHAVSDGAVLSTSRGAFTVTPECLVSPIIPLWILGVWLWPLRRWQRAMGLALTLPIVGLLACVRLLVLAVPGAWVESPLLVVHSFYQLLLFAAIVMMTGLHAAPRVGSRGHAARRGLAALALSGLAALAGAGLYNRFLEGVGIAATPWFTHTLTTLLPLGDIQGALAILPAYQILLCYAMVWAFARPVRRSTLIVAAAALVSSHIVMVIGIGELVEHGGLHLPALVLRGWAVIWPVAIALLVIRRTAPRAADAGDERTYRHFWEGVGAEFPDLGGAPSTALYFENECRLIADHLGDLSSKRVLKTDLWDEARNTRILQWVQRQGADVTGIDISTPVVRLAEIEFGHVPLKAAGADVRALPFPDRTFHAIYSMGTIEHFAGTERAVAEMFRVLRPGGRAIIGVPNRHDPFLRPLLVSLLYRLGLYSYGFEKSYSRASLRRMLADAGFRVVSDDAILFIPGWLRMLDLFFHTKWRPGVELTRVGVDAFRWIGEHVPAVRRHGYLVVAVGERPVFSPFGQEWIVDARGCDAGALRSGETLQTLFAEIVKGVNLTPIGSGQWHTFDGQLGMTGLQLLSESHLACHTYPEDRYAAFSLYSCGPTPVEWPWADRLASVLGATEVDVRVVRRGPIDRAGDA